MKDKSVFYSGIVTDNDIGDEGLLELSKGLKENRGVTLLNLECKEWMDKHIFHSYHWLNSE